jgi:isoleucyl-tRNA synthetase
VLSFTAEEAWQAVPRALRGDAESIFDTSFDAGRHRGASAEGDIRLWQQLRALRARVAAVASPRDFEAQLRLTVTPAAYKRLAPLGDNLREALVVSQLELLQNGAGEESNDGVLAFELFPAAGAKCARCWKFRELGTDPGHPEICADCAQVVSQL